eukprot:gene23006-27833_t
MNTVLGYVDLAAFPIDDQEVAREELLATRVEISQEGSGAAHFVVQDGTVLEAYNHRFLNHLLTMKASLHFAVYAANARLYWIRCIVSISPTYFGRSPARANVFPHLRCDWHNFFADQDAASAPGACGVFGCKFHKHVASPAVSFADLLADLRPARPREDETAVHRLYPRFHGIGDLPEPALEGILEAMDTKTVCALACTCRGFWARASLFASGLHTKLYAHQIAFSCTDSRLQLCNVFYKNGLIADALLWMRKRERQLNKKDGSEFSYHTSTGELRVGPPVGIWDFAGGLLCDEPGLGKSVTVIALILTTLRHPRQPPRGHAVQVDAASGARYYLEGVARGMNTIGIEAAQRMGLRQNYGSLSGTGHYYGLHNTLKVFKRIRQDGALGKLSHALCLADVVDECILQVHWLRVVLDEGHQLGASLQMTSRLSTACNLRAERRWIMTGTPTPLNLRTQVQHLQPLLAFLGQEPFGKQRGEWVSMVQQPLDGKDTMSQLQAVEVLGGVLRQTMCRTMKQDICLLPLVREDVVLDFGACHRELYNELVALIKRNLLLADWFDPSHAQSLLNRSNTKQSHTAATNLREACCVAGRAPVTYLAWEVEETIELVEKWMRAHERLPASAEWERLAAELRVTVQEHRGLCARCLTLSSRDDFWTYRDDIPPGVHLDSGSLKAAAQQVQATLEPAKECAERRVYLSKATLLVIPTVLIGHWLHQLAPYLPNGKPGGLRHRQMRVLVVNKERPPEGYNADFASCFEDIDPVCLAQNWDLVLMPTQLLTSQFGKDSPLIQ